MCTRACRHGENHRRIEEGLDVLAFDDRKALSGTGVSGAPLELTMTIQGISPNRVTGSYTEPARFLLRGKPQRLWFLKSKIPAPGPGNTCVRRSPITTISHS